MTRFTHQITGRYLRIDVDDRFRIAIERKPAATGSATTVVIDVYPIIDGQPWDIPCDFLIIEEADILEIENAREDDQ
jgi:hypothetical protein